MKWAINCIIRIVAIFTTHSRYLSILSVADTLNTDTKFRTECYQHKHARTCSYIIDEGKRMVSPPSMDHYYPSPSPPRVSNGGGRGGDAAALTPAHLLRKHLVDSADAGSQLCVYCIQCPWKKL